jgi:hypothetical protein
MPHFSPPLWRSNDQQTCDTRNRGKTVLATAAVALLPEFLPWRTHDASRLRDRVRESSRVVGFFPVLEQFGV